MSNIRIKATLKAIQAKPDSDGDVLVEMKIVADFTRDAVRLMPRAGQDFTVVFEPLQIEMSGIDLALGASEMARADR